MPLLVAVAPEQRPMLMLLDVAQPSDGLRRPIGAGVAVPRRPPLRDRDRIAFDDRLNADLSERVRRHSLLAEGPDRGDVNGRRAGHPTETRRPAQAARRSF